MSVRDYLTEEEKQIFALIKAAKDEALITEYVDDGEYISCNLDGAHYELCLGFNPSPEHPYAERAIRASRFVTRLMDKIKRDYSCYFVYLENDFYPSESILKDKLNASRSLKITGIDAPKEEEASSDCFVSSYEIEVEIVATIGETYERMVDFLSVDQNTVYTYKHSISPKVLTKNLAPNEMINAQKRAKEILNLALYGQFPGKRKDENVRKKNIQQMLNTLAEAENSRFRGFLDRVSDIDAKVGQISVKPCSILIDAIEEKKFVYRVSCGNNTGDLSVIWRSGMEEFEENTQLYLHITPKGEFVGLKNTKSPHPINNFNFLVLAHKATLQDDEIIISPDRWTLNEAYNQYITNYAVPVERDGIITYFFEKYAVKTDGKWRLKLDCKKCELTDDFHYCKDLSQEYYLKDGEIKFGAVYTAGAQSFTCETCLKTIYYLGDEHLAYYQSHTLLDGKHYCSECTDTIRFGNLIYKKTDGVANGKKIGTVYALVDGNDFVPIADGGNVFVCSNCGKTVLYDKKTESNCCDICHSHICSNCAANADSDHIRKKVLNTGTLSCGYCASGALLWHESENKYTELYKVEDENGQEQFVLDNTLYPELIFHCVECGKPRYYDKRNSEKHKKCSSCGRIVCSCCTDKCLTDIGLGLTYCSDCASLLDEKYKAERNTAEDIFQNAKKYEIRINHSKVKANNELKGHFLKNINKYLPYLSMADRKLIRNGIKEHTEAFHINCISLSVLEKAINYKFTLSVTGGKAYLFYLMKNKLTYGGIFDGGL